MLVDFLVLIVILPIFIFTSVLRFFIGRKLFFVYICFFEKIV